MNGRFLLPALLFLTIAALLCFLFFWTPSDVSQQHVEKQNPTGSNASKRQSIQGNSKEVSEPNLDLTSRIKKLFDGLPKLHEREQEKCAEEIAKLSDDHAAVEWSKKMISNSIPLAAANVLFNDLLNRPPQVLQPFLAEIADQRAHPLKEECTAALEFLYDSPPAGKNWKNWVKEKLAEE